MSYARIPGSWYSFQCLRVNDFLNSRTVKMLENYINNSIPVIIVICTIGRIKTRLYFQIFIVTPNAKSKCFKKNI